MRQDEVDISCSLLFVVDNKKRRVVDNSSLSRIAVLTIFPVVVTIGLAVDNYIITNCVVSGQCFCDISMGSESRILSSRWPDLVIDNKHSNVWNACIGDN